MLFVFGNSNQRSTCSCIGCNRPRANNRRGGYYSHCGNYCRHSNCHHPKQVLIRRFRKSRPYHCSSHALLVHPNYYGMGPHLLLGFESRGRYSGKLNMIGGMSERGETALETMLREAKEEFGRELKNVINNDNNKIMCSSLKTNKAKLFIVTLPAGFSTTKSFHPTQVRREILSVHWISFSNLTNLRKNKVKDSRGTTYVISSFVIENLHLVGL